MWMNPNFMKRGLDEPVGRPEQKAARVEGKTEDETQSAWVEDQAQSEEALSSIISKLKDRVVELDAAEMAKLRADLMGLLVFLKAEEEAIDLAATSQDPQEIASLLRDTIQAARARVGEAGGVYDRWQFLQQQIPTSNITSKVMSASITDHTNDYHDARAIHWTHFFDDIRTELQEVKDLEKDREENPTLLPAHSPFMALPIFRELDLHCVMLYLLSIINFLVSEESLAGCWSDSIFFWTSRIPNSMMREKQTGDADCNTYAMNYGLTKDETLVFHGGACMEVKTLRSLIGTSWNVQDTDELCWAQIMGYLKTNHLAYGILTNIERTWFLHFDEDANCVKISDPVLSKPTDLALPTLMECLFAVTRLSCKAVFTV